jgi:hypothetical protein
MQRTGRTSVPVWRMILAGAQGLMIIFTDKDFFVKSLGPDCHLAGPFYITSA